MPTLEAVEHDPFQPQIVPVDHDPFDAAAARVRGAVMPSGGRREGLATTLPEQMAMDTLSIPKRAIGAAQQYSETGEYNPAPMLSAAMMGLGGISTGLPAGRVPWTTQTEFLEAARRGRLGPGERPVFTRIDREPVDLRGDPNSPLWHHDAGHNLGYKTDDIAHFLAHREAMKDPSYAADALYVAKENALGARHVMIVPEQAAGDAFHALQSDLARLGEARPASAQTRSAIEQMKSPGQLQFVPVDHDPFQ